MEREVDLVVFGGSGVTGKFVIEELAVHGGEIKWAVAGRNETKLRNALVEIAKITDKDLSAVKVIVADVTSDALVAMCEQAKIVLNCVGPFRFFGEEVVKACIEAGTHYVDVSGEPQFLESMQLKYFKVAKEKNVYIVGACGFDSVPCDMGVEYVRQKFDGDVNGVETYLQFSSPEGVKVNFGTWQSAVHSLANAGELRPVREALKKELFPKGIPKSGHRLGGRPVLFKSKDVNHWCIPFMGSDRSVVLRTQMYGYEYENKRPIQIYTYFCLSSLLSAFLLMILVGIFVLLAKTKIGRYLLEEYPEIFSLGLFTKNPTREELINGSFSMTLCATGWSQALQEPSDSHSDDPDKKMKVTISGPSAGYVTTAICLVCSCLTVLEEQDKMPKNGGVFTPGAAFANTSLIDKLNARGVVMNVVE